MEQVSEFPEKRVRVQKNGPQPTFTLDQGFAAACKMMHHNNGLLGNLNLSRYLATRIIEEGSKEMITMNSLQAISSQLFQGMDQSFYIARGMLSLRLKKHGCGNNTFLYKLNQPFNTTMVMDMVRFGAQQGLLTPKTTDHPNGGLINVELLEFMYGDRNRTDDNPLMQAMSHVEYGSTEYKQWQHQLEKDQADLIFIAATLEAIIRNTKFRRTLPHADPMVAYDSGLYFPPSAKEQYQYQSLNHQKHLEALGINGGVSLSDEEDDDEFMASEYDRPEFVQPQKEKFCHNCNAHCNVYYMPNFNCHKDHAAAAQCLPMCSCSAALYITPEGRCNVYPLCYTCLVLTLADITASIYLRPNSSDAAAATCLLPCPFNYYLQKKHGNASLGCRGRICPMGLRVQSSSGQVRRILQRYDTDPSSRLFMDVFVETNLRHGAELSQARKGTQGCKRATQHTMTGEQPLTASMLHAILNNMFSATMTSEDNNTAAPRPKKSTSSSSAKKKHCGFCRRLKHYISTCELRKEFLHGMTRRAYSEGAELEVDKLEQVSFSQAIDQYKFAFKSTDAFKEAMHLYELEYAVSSSSEEEEEEEEEEEQVHELTNDFLDALNNMPMPTEMDEFFDMAPPENN